MNENDASTGSKNVDVSAASGSKMPQDYGIISGLSPDEGKAYAIAGVIASLVGFAIVGLILSIVGYIKSKKSGRRNILAIFGIVLGAVLFVVGTIFAIWFMQFAFDTTKGIVEKCQELGPGIHTVGDTTYECGQRKTEFKVGI